MPFHNFIDANHSAHMIKSAYDTATMFSVDESECAQANSAYQSPEAPFPGQAFYGTRHAPVYNDYTTLYQRREVHLSALGGQPCDSGNPLKFTRKVMQHPHDMYYGQQPQYHNSAMGYNTKIAPKDLPAFSRQDSARSVGDAFGRGYSSQSGPQSEELLVTSPNDTLPNSHMQGFMKIYAGPDEPLPTYRRALSSTSNGGGDMTSPTDSGEYGDAAPQTQSSSLDFEPSALRHMPVKPPYSYATLIAKSLLDSPIRAEGKTLKEIYRWLEEHYVYFRRTRAFASWRSSVRHNLCSSNLFTRVTVANAEAGAGKATYWRIADESRAWFDDSGIYMRRPRSSKSGLAASNSSPMSSRSSSGSIVVSNSLRSTASAPSLLTVHDTSSFNSNHRAPSSRSESVSTSIYRPWA